MEKPILLVMAAGMGSRYGGLKQIDPIGPAGEVIIDYSIYDAIQAGFEKVVFIIKKEIEDDFKAVIGARLAKHIKVEYAFQDLDDLPEGFKKPEDRVKPWGTAHAILAARRLVNGPFAVINADDYYGPSAFKSMYDYLSTHDDDNGIYEYSMVGYQIENTLTENGYVARGVCSLNENGFLDSVTERTRIEKTETGCHFTLDEGESWEDIPVGTLVSMNLWGFTKSFVIEANARFGEFLEESLKTNPLKCEYFLPSVVTALLNEDKARVKVLSSSDKWYGVTYKEDKPTVAKAISDKHEQGMYPSPLWK